MNPLEQRYKDAQANPNASTAVKRLAAHVLIDPDLVRLDRAGGGVADPTDAHIVKAPRWRNLDVAQIAADWVWYREWIAERQAAHAAKVVGD